MICRAHAVSATAVASRRRTAGEDPAPARRVARSGRLERTADGHGLEARHAVGVHRVQRRQIRLQQRRRQRVRLLDEGHADGARAGLDRHPHLHPRFDDLDGVVGTHQRGLVVLGRPHRHQVHALAVHADLDLVRRGQPSDEADVRPPQLGLDHVLAVERKRVANQRAAARAERQSIDVPGLRQVEPDAMRLVGGRAGRIADGRGADLLGGGDVAFEQHRRDAQHVGHVVEAEARVVGRQQRRRVDVERQQIADRRSGTRRGSAGAAPDVPDSGLAAASRSKVVSRNATSAARAGPSGCGMP